MLARDKSKNAVATKIMQGIMLILLTSGIAQIIAVGSIKGATLLEKMTSLIDDGTRLRGGGLCSMLLGWPLLALFKRTGAAIIIILITFIFIMLLTNLTLIDLFNIITKPFRKGYSAVKENQVERVSALAESQENDKDKKGAKIAPEKIPKSERKNKRVDVAKYIQDDENDEEVKVTPLPKIKPIINDLDDESNDNVEDKIDELDIILPFPIKSPKGKRKITIDTNPNDVNDLDKVLVSSSSSNESLGDANNTVVTKKKRASKKSEDKLLAEIIKNALPDDNQVPDINPLYVDNDGQTTFFDKDNSTPVYKEPPVSLLKYGKSKTNKSEIENEIQNKSETLTSTLQSFGVQSRIVGIHRGPSVTRYEVQPAAGVKVSKITGLADDIALNLAAEGIRLEAPIPGKAAIGIEIANKHRDMVSIRELIDSDEYRASKGKLTFAVGKDIEGKIIMGDISKMPHLLIAGTTGSGKSVFTNSIIMNILYHASPEDVKIILIDPKQVEFPIYNGIPHLLIPVVTEARKAAGALGWAVTEMTKRYNIFAESGVRDIEDYNKLVQTQENMVKMSQIIIVIDELADLMMAAPKEVEESICRIAQLARAAGMHLIIATQSPRVDVVTGLIKANIPSRIALKVSNNMDSRVILDEGGAEKLLGNGDMLYKPVGIGKPKRIQGSYVPTSEVREV
ncbi:MAG: DNA translocase FtsK, partial [Clostridiales bacterium]|nr:DNA translocase FtsK [Clostridiales bacterium]